MNNIPWEEIRTPETILKNIPGAKCFQKGRMFVIRSITFGRYHLAISHPNQTPPWGEIVHAREMLLPAGKFFIMTLPPEKYNVSLHKFAMHLWEITEEDEPELIKIIKMG